MVHAYYQYVVRAEPSFPLSRDELVQALMEEGVGCRPSYPMPLYKQKALADLRLRGRCPVAEDIVGRLFELPVHPAVEAKDLATIVSAVDRLATPA
jgi:dTDP-4-amino-4,6-dideoxygalactose transaminase